MFRRGLRKPQMMAALAELAAKESWWRDVLRDPSLVIGVRDDYLNVYWRGQSLFMAQMKVGRVVAATHPKYLLNPDLAGQVALDPVTGAFPIDAAKMITQAYRPGETLAKIKKAAALFAGEEKEGVQAIVSHNPDVVDVEVAFPGETALRVDIASFEDQGDHISLAFWEAKAFGNPELRATGEKNVVSQIKTYVDLLNQHRAACCDPLDFRQLRLESGPKEGPDDEAIKVHGRADHRDPAGAGGGCWHG